MVEIRKIFWQCFAVTEHACELLRNLRGVRLIVVDHEGLIALLLVFEQTLQCGLLQMSVHLPADIGSGPAVMLRWLLV